MLGPVPVRRQCSNPGTCAQEADRLIGLAPADDLRPGAVEGVGGVEARDAGHIDGELPGHGALESQDGLALVGQVAPGPGLRQDPVGAGDARARGPRHAGAVAPVGLVGVQPLELVQGPGVHPCRP